MFWNILKNILCWKLNCLILKNKTKYKENWRLNVLTFRRLNVNYIKPKKEKPLGYVLLEIPEQIQIVIYLELSKITLAFNCLKNKNVFTCKINVTYV